MSKLKSMKICVLLAAVLLLTSCSPIGPAALALLALGSKKSDKPSAPSQQPHPRVIVTTPGSPASGDVTITFQVIDRELEQVHVMVEYSTDGGQTFNPATLVQPSAATNLESDLYPGVTHSIQWDSVSDNVGISFAQVVCVKITPSDASNPSGTADVSGAFSMNNIAFNQAPVATVLTPAGVSWGNIQITYFLADVESNTCSIAVEFSVDSGLTWATATMGPAGEGMTSLSSSPSGAAHTFLWDSRFDNIAPAGQVDTIRIRIIPTDFHQGTAGESNSFSVDNTVTNNPPTVAITGGPAESSTVSTNQVTFTWDGADTDGTVIGYYYSFDHDPPDNWTTDTTVTSGSLSDGAHTFRVVAIDDSFDLSTIVSRTFTVTTFEPLQADFSASTTNGIAPLTVDFTDLSSGSITAWSWDFGDSGTSSGQNPSHTYNSAGTYTVSLSISNAADSDTVTKIDYITVTVLNTPPTAAAETPAGVESGDIQINYTLTDIESDTCMVIVYYSIDNGSTWSGAVMGSGGDGLSGLSSSPTGTAHVFIWDSLANNVALGSQMDTVKIKILPTDTQEGTAGETGIFSVDNTSPARNWIDKSPANKPSARYFHAMAYDSLNGVVVLFGGYDGTSNFDDTWEYDGTDWTEKFPLEYPPARRGHKMVYDSNRDVVVLFGGVGNSGFLDDTWEWNGANWTEKSPASKPSARSHHGMAYDSARSLSVVFGGYHGGSTPAANDNETWVWDGTNWIKKNPANSPFARCLHALAYDSARQVVVLFGGERSGATFHDDTWEWNGTTWQERYPATKPNYRSSYAMAYDSSWSVVVLFGGSHGSDETWEYDGIDWTEKFLATNPPSRYRHAMTYDSSRGVVVLFGGYRSGAPLDDTWEY